MDPLLQILGLLERIVSSGLFNALVIGIIPVVIKQYKDYTKLQDTVKSTKIRLRLVSDVNRRILYQLRNTARSKPLDQDELISCLTKMSIVTDEMFREEDGYPRRSRGENS